jgi:hypothetical protein
MMLCYIKHITSVQIFATLGMDLTTRWALCRLMEHAVHGFDIGVAVDVEHAAHHAGQAFLEGGDV